MPPWTGRAGGVGRVEVGQVVSPAARPAVGRRAGSRASSRGRPSCATAPAGARCSRLFLSLLHAAMTNRADRQRRQHRTCSLLVFSLFPPIDGQDRRRTPPRRRLPRGRQIVGNGPIDMFKRSTDRSRARRAWPASSLRARPRRRRAVGGQQSGEIDHAHRTPSRGPRPEAARSTGCGPVRRRWPSCRAGRAGEAVCLAAERVGQRRFLDVAPLLRVRAPRANEQPGGGASRFGGRPVITRSRVWLGSSRRGIERSSASVYGWRIGRTARTSPPARRSARRTSRRSRRFARRPHRGRG